jgi:hypothetical protein
MILGESGKDEPAHGHNITACVRDADWHVDNSGSLEDLKAATRHFIDAIILVTVQKE